MNRALCLVALVLAGCASPTPSGWPMEAAFDPHPLVIYLAGPGGHVINADASDRATRASVAGGVVALTP